MPYDDATAVLPPMPDGYSSVMRPDQVPPPTPAFGQADSDRIPPGMDRLGVDDQALFQAGAHADLAMHDRQQDSINYEKRFLPAQVSQITQLNSQKAAVAWALNQGQIRPQEARARMQSLDLQIKGIQPSMVPKMKPAPMADEYKDRVFTDHNQNLFIRNPDGTWDVRPPSPHSPIAQHAQQLHEAAMGHAAEQQDAAEQWRDHHHEAQIAQGQIGGDVQLTEKQIAQEHAKAQTEQIKAQAAQQKQQHQFEDHSTKEAERLQEQSQRHVEATIKQQQQETDSAKKEYWQHVERLRKQTKQEAEDAANAQYAATKKRVAPTYPSDDELHQRVIKDLSRFDPDFESKLMAKPKGQPTLAPKVPEGWIPNAPVTPNPTMPPGYDPNEPSHVIRGGAPAAAGAPSGHPDLRPDAPPQALKAITDMEAIVRDHPNPATWDQATRDQFKALKAVASPYRR